MTASAVADPAATICAAGKLTVAEEAITLLQSGSAGSAEGEGEGRGLGGFGRGGLPGSLIHHNVCAYD